LERPEFSGGLLIVEKKVSRGKKRQKKLGGLRRIPFMLRNVHVYTNLPREGRQKGEKGEGGIRERMGR